MLALGLLFWVAVPLFAQAAPASFAAALIAVRPADEPGFVLVEGQAGAVAPRAQLALRSALTGEIAYANAAADGSFQARMPGTPALPYELYSATSITDAQRRALALPSGPALRLQQFEPSRGDAIPFELAGRLSYGALTWQMSGTLATASLAPGATLRLDAEIFFPALNLNAELPLRVSGRFSLLPLADAAGALHYAGDALPLGWASQQTPLGLPIEGVPPAAIALPVADFALLLPAEPGFRASLAFAAPLPDDLPAGRYLLAFEGLARVADSAPFDWYANRIFSTLGRGPEATSRTLLPLTLEIDQPESVQLPLALFGALLPADMPGALNTGRQHAAPLFVLPPGIYPLDLTWLPAALAFSLPSAELRAEIRRPDGARQSLPPAPLRQAYTQEGRANLTTLDPAWNVELLDYGDYEITLTASLRDAAGLPYSGGGIYRLTIAEPLRMEPALLPGTPLVAGAALHPGLRLLPAVPAEVRVNAAFAPLTGDPVPQTRSGRASQGGVFSADALVDLPAGEYLLDYEARFRDSSGRLWAVALRTAGVITSPDAPPLRGRRGISGYERPAQAWFDMQTFPPDSPNLAPFPYSPFFSGDLVFSPDGANSGLHPWLALDESAASAAYFFTAARPGILQRAYVMADPAALPAARWHNDELSLVGAEGLRPGDWLLLFGGARSASAVSGYASVAIVTPATSTARVVPPFSGPLLTYDGLPVELFFVPGALAPGDLLETGQSFALAGQIVPPVPALAAGRLIAPDGSARTFAAQASAFGLLYDPALDFALDQPGIWTLELELSYAGATSVGMLDRTVTGTTLGATDGRYTFYVVEPGAPPLSAAQGFDVDLALTPNQQTNINASAPAAWTNLRAAYSLTFPGILAAQGSPTLVAPSLRYTFDPARLARAFAFYEPAVRAAGPATSDALRLTFFAQGLDETGRPQAQARVYAVFHDRLISLGAP